MNVFFLYKFNIKSLNETKRLELGDLIIRVLKKGVFFADSDLWLFLCANQLVKPNPEFSVNNVCPLAHEYSASLHHGGRLWFKMESLHFMQPFKTGFFICSDNALNVHVMSTLVVIVKYVHSLFHKSLFCFTILK